MKIKALAALCKKRKAIYLYEGENSTQWIGDGSVIYPLFNMPHLSKENIFTIFDIPDSKKADFYFNSVELPSTICFDDIEDGERKIKQEGMQITRMGSTMEPLKTSQGLVFIDTEYLKPLSDIKETLELYERITSSGKTYIAIKNGFLLMGIVGTFRAIDKDFVKQMEDLTSQCKLAYSNLPEEDKKE